MPQMGADMTEGTIVRWLKSEGGPVERGEIIAEIETDKANVEIEAFDSGVFRRVLANEGDTVAIGTVIAVIAAPEDDILQYEQALAAAKPAEPPKAEAKASAVPTAAAPAAGAPAGGAAPPPAPSAGAARARRVAPTLAL